MEDSSTSDSSTENNTPSVLSPHNPIREQPHFFRDSEDGSGVELHLGHNLKIELADGEPLFDNSDLSLQIPNFDDIPDSFYDTIRNTKKLSKNKRKRFLEILPYIFRLPLASCNIDEIEFNDGSAKNSFLLIRSLNEMQEKVGSRWRHRLVLCLQDVVLRETMLSKPIFVYLDNSHDSQDSQEEEDGDDNVDELDNIFVSMKKTAQTIEHPYSLFGGILLTSMLLVSGLDAIFSYWNQ